jgi:hypothetical protein
MGDTIMNNINYGNVNAKENGGDGNKDLTTLRVFEAFA